MKNSVRSTVYRERLLLMAAMVLGFANGFHVPTTTSYPIFDPRHNQSPLRPSPSQKGLYSSRSPLSSLFARNDDRSTDNEGSRVDKVFRSTLVAAGILAATWMPLPPAITSSLIGPQMANAETDSLNIVTCLFEKCSVPLAKCVANPMCLANVVCINTCNDKEDEIGCQIKCGDTFENSVVGEFNNCAISQMNCVEQKKDDGSYPVPPDASLVPKFDTKLFQGRWYITAGQNPLFDIFPCQVHFFTQPEPGKFFGQLNWRVEEPDGEFFTRDAIQRFVQDPKQPAHLLNHDNEYLHYEDDWYILDYEYDNNPDGIPPFAFVYYRGSNDAWDGYGGAVIYTRDASFPESLRPRIQEAAKKVNFDFDKDFSLTDNSCPVDLSPEDRLLLREKFLGDVVLQSEKQLQLEATRSRGNAVNFVQKEEGVVSKEIQQARNALKEFSKQTADFENEVIRDAERFESELAKDAGIFEKALEKDFDGIKSGIQNIFNRGK